MLFRRGLKSKLILVGLGITVPPLVAVFVADVRFGQSLETEISKSLESMAADDLKHINQSVVTLAKTAQALLEGQVKLVLTSSKDHLADHGGVRLNPEVLVRWTARNQYSGESLQAELPQMLLGEDWLGQVTDPQTLVPFIDDFKGTQGMTLTLFQRLNEGGDMLRVATSVVSKDGKRAIGTYLPRRQPDGQTNPVLGKVLRGEEFLGRAFVVDQWYVTAYTPIREGENVIGMLYVGIPERLATESVRKNIQEIQVGRTGYVFVLNAKDDKRGHYFISHKGQRDGENILNMQDADGRYFIRDMVDQAVTLPEGNFGVMRYPWQNTGEEKARWKITYFSYYAPWDWLIGVGSYEEEFYGAARTMRARLGERDTWFLSFIALGIVATCGVWFWMGHRLTKGILQETVCLAAAGDESTNAAGQISVASQNLAEGASEQASAVDSAVLSLQRVAEATDQNARQAQQADRQASEAGNIIGEGERKVEELKTAMGDLRQSSDEIAKIIHTINEIAFQTNLLALNAAVEAARAGEAGAGFAVVAEEVRALAQRSATAAKNTHGIIHRAIERGQTGLDISMQVSEQFGSLRDSVVRLSTGVRQIAEASVQQKSVIDEISTAVSEIERVTQRNAAAAEETASAAAELDAQQQELHAAIDRLHTLVKGHVDRAEAAAAEEAPVRATVPVAKPRPHKPAAPSPTRALPTTGAQLTFK